ncbi:hypothetical protein VitviT2T_027400 [Vitis vinifera]|uniref:Uncharacterized protein n=2 Tax=Vitis vinifera TaxID=29760 RepID=A0ABY9DT22_VITVI|eukprot:XP_002283527.2 PREDICTED: uncharacterized protein LOC100262671 [Vitis vinifera]
MALPASTVTVWSSRFRINLLRPCQLHGCSLSHAYNRQTLHSHSIKLRTMAQFSEQNKVKMQMSILRKRLWEAAPDSLKDFPWKKAEDTVLQQLLLLGQKALKWSFITLFILSSVSDVIFCISRNKELMIPFGLFVGCMMADFLKETSRELFPNSEKTGLKQPLLGIGCFFVFVKFMSTFLTSQGQAFLLHVANGGLMQILWLWKGLLEGRDGQSGQNFFSCQETSDITEAIN